MLFNGEQVGNGRGPAVRCRGRPDRRHVADRRRPQERALGDRRVRSRHHARRVDGLLHGQARHRSRRRRRRRHPPAHRREHPPARRRRSASRSTRWSSRCCNRPRHEQLIADIREAGAGTRLMSRRRRRRRHQRRPPQRAHRHVRRRRRQPRGHRHRVRDQGARRAHPGASSGRATTTRSRRAPMPGSSSTATSTRPTSSSPGSNTIFVATGVTDGQLVAGVRREGDFIYTESVVLRGALRHAAPHRLGAPRLEVAVRPADRRRRHARATRPDVAVVTES